MNFEKFIAGLAITLAIVLAFILTVENADAAVSWTVLDKTEAPVVMFGFECSGENAEAIAAECRAELINVCPNGGLMSPIQASPEGYSPPTIRFVVKCDITHEDSI